MDWRILIVLLVVCAGADLAGMLLWYACANPKSQLLGPALVRGRTNEPHIALTFDDGPQPPYTDRILDILQEHRTPAAFFVCGRNVELYPETVQRAPAEGHVLGNHTYSHPYLYGLSHLRIAEEIEKTQQAVFHATGVQPQVFRPPYGARWFGLYSVLKRNGLSLIAWSISPRDWELTADEIVEKTLRHLRPGAVIVLHDGIQPAGGYLQWKLGKAGGRWVRPQTKLPSPDRSPTVAALPAILQGASKLGFKFVSIAEFVSFSMLARG